jgi:hypothetical protein
VTSGYGQEANPFVRIWISHGGFLAIKVSGAFLATLPLWIKYNAKPRLVYATTGAFLVFYTIIAFWNLFVFLVTVYPTYLNKASQSHNCQNCDHRAECAIRELGQVMDMI